MNTTKTTLYVGLNDKDTKTQKVDTMEAYKIVTTYISGVTDGCTIYNANGVYRHDDGSIVIEDTLRIELFEDDPAVIDGIITTLKRLLNQESIIKQIEHVNTVFC